MRKEQNPQGVSTQRTIWEKVQDVRRHEASIDWLPEDRSRRVRRNFVNDAAEIEAIDVKLMSASQRRIYRNRIARRL